MTIKTLCSDMLLLAVFMLMGFFIREYIKPLQKLFLPASLIGGLLILLLGQQVLGVVTVPDSYSECSDRHRDGVACIRSQF